MAAADLPSVPTRGPGAGPAEGAVELPPRARRGLGGADLRQTSRPTPEWTAAVAAWREGSGALRWLRWFAPAAVVALVIAVETQVRPSDPAALYAVLLTAALLCALLLGGVSGYWTLALSVAGTAFFVLKGEGFAVSDPSEALGLFTFAAAGAVLIPVVQSVEAARVRAAATSAACAREAAEATTLLTELSHRVGNDLHMLVALTSLQAAQSAPACQGPLSSLAERIVVLGRVYRRLNHSATEGAVEVREFLDGLCNDLREAHLGLRPVALRVEAAEAEVTATVAVTLGLFTNEAVTNALKYAFPNEEGGAITVVFGADPTREARYVLEVRDDGRGVSAAPSPTGTGLGSRLTKSMAAQLGGHSELVREGDATVCRLSFPMTAR